MGSSLHRFFSPEETDHAFRRRILILLVIGLLIRLTLMPIAFHPDLFWVTYRAHLLALHGEVNADLLVQPIPPLLYGTVIWLLQSVISPQELIWPDLWASMGQEGFQGAFDLRMQIAKAPGIHLTLFLLKLPHLLFDFASAFLLLALLKKKPSGALLALAFWMLNPIGLYISYLYGRYDVVAGTFMLLSLYLLTRSRPLSSLATLALTLLTRLIDLAVAPFFFLSAFLQLAKQRRLMLGSLVMGGVALLTLITGMLPRLLALLDRIHGQFLLMARLPILLNDALLIFVIVYGILFFSSLEQGLSSSVTVRKYATMALLVMFSLAFFNPQYFFAVLPLLALEIAEQPRLLLYHLVQIFGYAVYLLNWRTQTTTWIFLPLNPRFFSRLPDPCTLIESYITPRAFIAIFRSLLSAASLWMVYLIYRSLPKKGA